MGFLVTPLDDRDRLLERSFSCFAPATPFLTLGAVMWWVEMRWVSLSLFPVYPVEP